MGEVPKGAARGLNSDTPREPTIIDLKRPSDLVLLHRAVVNRWPTEQHIREQISAQMVDALEFYGSNSDNPRWISRVIKLARIALLMDVSNDVDDGLRKSLHPIGRKRGPERRRPRRETQCAIRVPARLLDPSIARIAQKNPALAAAIQKSLSPVMYDDTATAETEHTEIS